MIRRTLILASVLANLLLISAPALAAPVSISFETFPGPDGVLGTADDVPSYGSSIIPLRDEYASIGLTFNAGTLFKDSFFDGNPGNHFLSSTNPVAVLSVPVFGISIDSYSYWNATLSAFNNNGQLINSFTLINPNSGSQFLRGTLALTTSERIYGFSILPDDPRRILNLDNLVLNVDPSAVAVPEPSQMLLFPLALGLLGAARARARARPKR